MQQTFLDALELAVGLEPRPSAIERVAQKTSPEAAAWAFTQWALRSKAKDKFKTPEAMLFVREALEQASHEEVAKYHTSHFPKGVLVADLTVGIGSDLIALARRGPTLGFEMDKERADIAQHNLKANGLEADVRNQNCLKASWEFEYAFADPARRVEGRRTLSPEEFSPPIQELSERMSALKLGGIKLSPMLPDDFLASIGPRIEFISYGRECREAIVWLGSDVIPGRYVVHIESGSTVHISSDTGIVQTTDDVRGYVYEADPAVIRAHGLGALCKEHDLSLLADSNGYLTGDLLCESPWLRRFQVLYAGPGDVKKTKQALRSLECSTPEIKSRGVRLEPRELQQKLRSEGPRHNYLFVYKSGPKTKHIIAEEVS